MDELTLITILIGAAAGAKLTTHCRAVLQHLVTGIGAIGGWLVIDYAPELLALAPLLLQALKMSDRDGSA